MAVIETNDFPRIRPGRYAAFMGIVTTAWKYPFAPVTARAFRASFFTFKSYAIAVLVALLASALLDRGVSAHGSDCFRTVGQEKPATRASQAGEAQDKRPEPGKAPATGEQDINAQRINLKGVTDTAAGENRRNDNIHFNPVDNNALRDLNLRIGVSATAVREFEPHNRYFSAEYGTRPTTPIHGALAPAARVHGSVYETHANSIFSARSYFQVGSVRPARENSYGFILGTPLGGRSAMQLEGGQQKVRGSVNGNVLVPGAAERTPLTEDLEIRPIVERILASYPAELPNRTDIDDRALNTNSPQHIDTDRISAAAERRFAGGNQLVARYSLTSQQVQSFQFVAGQNYDSDVRAHVARITWRREWGAGTVGELSAGFERLRTALMPEARAAGASAMTFIIQPVGTANNPMLRAINDFQYEGRLYRTGGNHSWSAGFAVTRRQVNGSETSGHRGSFFFADGFGRDAVTNLRMGTPIRYTVTIGETARGFRNWLVTFYVGDRWRVTPDLTLNLGLRYELVTRPVEVDDLDILPFGCDCNNAAPSVGLAYRLPGTWGVMRSAYGVHYGQIFPVTYGQIRFNPPRNIGLTVDQPNMAHPLAGLDLTRLGAETRSSLTEISPDLVVPYSHQYNLTWEPGSWDRAKLQLAYVGSRTLKLFSSWSMNRANPVDGIPQTLATVNMRRPDPLHYIIQRVGNGSRAYYDAARISLIVPQQRGWSFDAAYWFSKSVDLNYNFPETGFGSIPPPQSDEMIHQDFKGVSNFHQPHAFLGRVSWDLPSMGAMPGWVRNVFGAWGLSLVLLMKSGTPFTVFAGSDAPGFGNVDGETGDRVDVVDPTVLGRTVGDPDTSTQLLPRSAFRFISPTALRGNIGRNTFRKGKIANVNAALGRIWVLRQGESSLTVRAESINLFNTPQFADPERNLSSKTFGRITNTLNMGRSFQFTLRLSF